ncbi:hypothetical protein JCM10450v2_003258 [Rhodotorula kratochvilovae]
MPSSSLVALASLALLALSPFATARPAPSRTQQAKRYYETPSAKLPAPQYLEDKAILAMINRMAAAAQASAAVKARRSALDDVVDVDFQKRADVGGDTLFERAAPCLDSTATDTLISSMFYYGGEGTVVELCPGATIQLQSAIFFSAKNQVLTTQGNPLDGTRAKLVVAGADQSCAIYGACAGCDGVTVQSVQVAGSRDTMGYNSGIALLEMGGNNVGQTVKNTKLWEPRGWSALHGIEGDGNSCHGMVITGNEIGPSGNSPTTGAQFLKRDATVYPPNQWADGISIACKGSSVKGNTIIDATDGGIVIFGAPGSQISGNTILARERRPLGGINLVDWAPYSGSFEGTVVEGNTLYADTNMMKIGIALGGMSWGSDNRTAARTFGGTVRNNMFKTGSTGYFGYSISVAGHQNAVITGNMADGAAFGGEASASCVPNPAVPASQAFVYDKYTTTGTQLQGNFVDAPLVFLICQQPGPVVARGPAGSASGSFISGQQPAAAPSSAAASTTTTTTTSAQPTSTSKTTTTTTTSARVNRVAFKDRFSTSSSTTTTTTTTSKAAASTAATLRMTWSKVIAAFKPHKRDIVQDGAASQLEARASVAGPSKPTPVAALVNPFAVLEKHARLA